MPTLKILVGYHKPAKLYKSEEFVPIHLGRALATSRYKDGVMSQEDYQWMLDNMIGDDTGDNISDLNRYFCELTGIYWAWKNYDKLGNPDYIGFMHYRRPFSAETLANYADYDITACLEKGKKSIKTQFVESHGQASYDSLCSVLLKQDKTDFENYMNGTTGYFYNMFIMKKDIFFKYCEWLFEILFALHKKTDYHRLSFYNQRMPGYVAERLTGCFISRSDYKVNPCRVKLKDEPARRCVTPRFDDKSINVCFASDDNYAPYLAVVIQSIKVNNKSNSNYDICVLDNNISLANKKKILSLCQDNFSIRFIDINPFLEDIDINIFSLNAHFTIATYFRFFIPQIFKKYEKIIYLDCDIVVHHDLAELFNQNLSGKALAAALDTEMQREAFIGDDDYTHQILNMKHPEKYLQAGVLVLDINKLQKMDFTNKCLQRLQEIKNPKYLDQCVLNSLFDGDIAILAPNWNVEWHIPYFVKDLDRQLGEEDYVTYIQSRQSPYILHYCGAVKPWLKNNLEFADIWWAYARQTPFYEDFMISLWLEIEKQRKILRKMRVKYMRYSLLTKITFGKLRKRYKNKKKKLKAKIEEIKQLLKEK